MQSRRILLALGTLAVAALAAAVLLWPSPGPATATGNSITSPDTGGGDISLTLDSSGNPVVSYHVGGPLNDLGVMHCNDPNCSGADESITSPDIANLVGEYTSLGLDASGNPVVTYYDATNQDLKVLHCGNANCTSGNSITSPDTGGGVGRWTSLALDALGNPVVSYEGNSGLKVLHCNDANCSGGDESITSPDTDGTVGWYTSLALDASGYPVVSYYDYTNDDLKVLHCNDPNCSGDDESITSPDTGGAVGMSTSLALDSSGNPVVSYWDGINDDLKVLHCNDPNCSGGDESITSPDTANISQQATFLTLDASGNPVVSYPNGAVAHRA